MAVEDQVPCLSLMEREEKLKEQQEKLKRRAEVLKEREEASDNRRGRASASVASMQLDDEWNRTSQWVGQASKQLGEVQIRDNPFDVLSMLGDLQGRQHKLTNLNEMLLC